MRAVYNALVAAAGISILAACTGGQSAIQPAQGPPTDVQHTTALQFRVGTFRTSGGSVFLNTVVTYRQQNGLSGTLYNTPTITGPAGLVVNPVAAAGIDGGTNHISATPPTQPGVTPVATTFGLLGGAYAYGFAPANNNINAQPNYINTLNPAIGNGGRFGCNICNANGFALANYYSSPFLQTGSSSNRTPFVLGPPAVPDFHNATFPNGFSGYDSGFQSFQTTSIAVGAYNLHVDVPGPAIGAIVASFDAPATMTTITPLPAEAAVVIAPVGKAYYSPQCPAPPPVGAPMCGGASFTVLPAAAGITNQVLYVVNGSTQTFYTFNAGAAGGTFVLSPTSGPKSVTGAATAPFTEGDNVYAYVVGADYDILGAAPPNNTQQLPTLAAQTDVVVGPGAATPFTY